MSTTVRIEQTFLLDALQEILISGEKFSEFELLTRLKSPPWEIFPKDALNDNLALFQTHFVLFHCLYKLQQAWVSETVGYLKISALHIQRLSLSHEETRSFLDEPGEQKVREYYYDWQNFQDTSETDVEALLESFWQKFGSVKHWQLPTEDEVKAAFEFFNVTEQSNWKDIRKAYLKTQLLSHPDKGGNESMAQENARHFDVLKRFFKSV